MFLRTLYLLVLLLLFTACVPPTWEDYQAIRNSSSAYDGYSEAAVEYFLEIGLCPEFSDSPCVPSTKKWITEVRIALHGNYTEYDVRELDRLITQLKALTEISIRRVNDGTANINIYYTPRSNFGQYINAANLDQDAYFQTNHSHNGRIVKSTICIDNTFNQLKKDHLLREELTQSFGIYNDSYAYANSVFQQDPSYKPTEYAEIDKEIIRLLYDPRIKSGMDKNEVIRVLKIKNPNTELAGN